MLLAMLNQIQVSKQLADIMSKLEQQQPFNLSSHTTDQHQSLPISSLHLTNRGTGHSSASHQVIGQANNVSKSFHTKDYQH